MSTDLDDICKSGAEEAFKELDLVDLNVILHRADGEERDATGMALLHSRQELKHDRRGWDVLGPEVRLFGVLGARRMDASPPPDH